MATAQLLSLRMLYKVGNKIFRTVVDNRVVGFLVCIPSHEALLDGVLPGHRRGWGRFFG
jgi:hypothetical protein